MNFHRKIAIDLGTAKVIKRIGAWVSLVSIISIMAGSTLNNINTLEKNEAQTDSVVWAFCFTN